MPTTVKMHAQAAAKMVALFGYTITVVILSTFSMSYENGNQTKKNNKHLRQATLIARGTERKLMIKIHLLILKTMRMKTENTMFYSPNNQSEARSHSLCNRNYYFFFRKMPSNTEILFTFLLLHNTIYDPI